MSAYEAGRKLGRGSIPISYRVVQMAAERFGPDAAEFHRGFWDGRRKTLWLEQQAAKSA